MITTDELKVQLAEHAKAVKDLEQIVGLQTDKPLKRAFMPYGGIKMAEQACTTYGYQPSEELHKIFTISTISLHLKKRAYIVVSEFSKNFREFYSK